MTPRTRRLPTPPSEFTFRREAPLGRQPLRSVFEGLEMVPPFAEYPGPARARRRVLQEAEVEIVRGPVWMYVAPHEVPPFAKDVGWTPVTSDRDCVVVGRSHLRRSPGLTVYLDILHEVCHLFQRRAGRDLWDLSDGYAGSPTELEAYGLVVREARRLGASERYLRGYLKVDWLDRTEHARLLRNLGVPAR